MAESIFLTGASGFVGRHIIRSFTNQYTIQSYQRGTTIAINQDVVIHVAGLAHDIAETANEAKYYEANTALTKMVFDAFLSSTAKIFIFLSSVKAAADTVNDELTETDIPRPQTPYGKSKLKAEEYIASKYSSLEGKKVYILRPTMIHGEGNKGNLNVLYHFLKKGYPWPLGAFHCLRSYCSIHNLLFVLNELITQKHIPSGVYNVCDDIPLNTNDIVRMMQMEIYGGKRILSIPRWVIKSITSITSMLGLPFNNEQLHKLTDSYIVSNHKLIGALKKKLPVHAEEAMLLTIQSLKNNDQ